MNYLVSISLAVEAPDTGYAVLRVLKHDAWAQLLADIGADYISVTASEQDDEE